MCSGKLIVRVWVVLLLGLFSGCGTRLTPKPESKVDQTLGPYQSAGLNRKELTDRDVLRAMAKVPRHRFVPEELSSSAYADEALPIGSGQTISQPFIVALMTQEAQIKSGSKVLEIGTGSGYQAAVLSQLGAVVYSIEIVPELAQRAGNLLKELGFKNVHVKAGDGWLGWPKAAPFDAILITAASPTVPHTLLAQLADGGRMVLPVEKKGRHGETLMLIQRNGDDLVSRELGDVKFVPLTGEGRSPAEKVDVLTELGAPAPGTQLKP